MKEFIWKLFDVGKVSVPLLWFKKKASCSFVWKRLTTS